jgi:tetratricopeptide (TPR) repeat protein
MRAGTLLLLAVFIAAACSKREPNTPPADAGTGIEVASRSPEAREHFRQGLAALHAFWYEESGRQFEAAIAADPSFAMAHWGLAMSKSKLLWSDDDLAGGRRALSRMPPSSGLSERERAWVAAAAALFGDGDVRSSRRAFAAAMERVHGDYPDDESAAFLAIALVATVRPEDPGGDPVRQRAAELALGVYERNPRHPGAAHYAIHALDAPATAARALPLARAYAALAPEAFHARHMPAHIFARLGLWKDVITSCESAWQASTSWAQRERLSVDHLDFHSLNWIVEASFERGRAGEARKAMQRFADAVKGGLGHQNRTAYAKQVASYMARTGEWSRVDELLAPLDAAVSGGPSGAGSRASAAGPSGAGSGQSGAGSSGAGSGSSAAGADGSTAGAASSGAGGCAGHPAPAGPPLALFEQRAVLNARARAAAMRRDMAATKRFLAERAALDERLRPFFAAAQPAQAARLDQERAVSDAAMLARARGDDRALLAPLRRQAESSRAEFAAEGTPGGSLAQEELADALLRLRRPAEALTAYQEVISEHPGRARALLGAARAAAQTGQPEAARVWYEKLAAVWSEADPETEGLAEARAALAR